MKKTALNALALLLVTFVVMGLVWSSLYAAKGKKDNASGAAAEGQKVFDKNCKVCHFPDKTDTKMGPGLKGLFKNKEMPASHKPVTEENVRQQIEEGAPHAKPMGMPSFKDKLSPQQIDDLIAYLKTL